MTMTLVVPTGPVQGYANEVVCDVNVDVPRLSAGADVIYTYVAQHGQVTDVQARLLLSADPLGALNELQAAWLIVHVPGGCSGRAGRARAAQFVAVPQGRRPSATATSAHAQLLRGCSGMLSFFARKLNLDAGETLAAMQALCEAGLASGGPVGASFAFRVFDSAEH